MLLLTRSHDYVLEMLLGSHDQSNRSMEGSVNKAVKLGSEVPEIGLLIIW